MKTPMTAVVLTTVLLSVIINVAAGTVPDRWRPWLWLSWPTMVLLVTIAVALERHRLWSRPERSTGAAAHDEDEAQLDLAVRVLADAVRGQWAEELKVRGLRGATPLRVCWSAVGGSLTAEPAVVLNDTTPGGRPVRLHRRGDMGDVVTEFRRLPHKQLAVLGEPGAGKSVLAMLLTVGLLEQRAVDEPVPVLVSLASWRPDTEHLHAWLARQLNDEYSFLTDTHTRGLGIARRLIDSGRIMPVLDGLDEISAPLRPIAIDRLDHVIGDRPLVVTSRWEEYLNAVDGGGHLMSKAAVITLEPVQVADVEKFLVTTSPSGGRWSRVLGAMRAHPGLPLAQALSSPLMVGLARAVYAYQETAPSELLDSDRFPDREIIERCLLEEFIPATYTYHPPPPGTRSSAGVPVRYEKELVRRWLVFLAQHMHRFGTRDLAWWQLTHVLPRYGVGILAGLVSGLTAGPPVGFAAGAMFAPQYQSVAGIATGLGVGLGAGLVAGLRQGVSPSRILLNFRGRGPQIRQSLATGLCTGPLAGVMFGLIFWLVAGIENGLEIGLIAGLVSGVVGGLGVGVMAAMRTPIDSTRIVSPLSLLRADRTAALLQAVVGGLAAAAGSGFLAALMARPEARPAVVVVAGLGVGIGVALVATCNTAWGQWALTRTWLALRNQTPWPVMGFLTEAHSRGVLRKTGGVYQFRHARLQEHLVLHQISISNKSKFEGAS